MTSSKVRSFRELVADGPAVGTFAKLPSTEVCEIVALAGFDFVIIDAEHAPLSVRDVYGMIVTYSSFGVTPLVRARDHGYAETQLYLDSGAAGVLVPRVTDARRTREVLRQFVFPPEGTRGMGYASRAGRWGLLRGGPAEYLGAGQEVALVPMIEEVEAVEAIDEILGLDEVSAVFVGPGDLSLGMGRPYGDPEVAAVVDEVIRRAGEAGVPVGINVAFGRTDDLGRHVLRMGELLARRADQGCSFLVAGNDTGIFGDGATAMVDSVRQALGARDDGGER
jgi:2-keto-3-deoxy-L-rhamnonate aldolase RhmA